jgi:transposase
MKQVISVEEWRPPEPAHVEKARLARRAGRHARYQQVVVLHEQGMREAVKAGLTWSINNGMVEGHVTKLKLIKSQGYGRAGFGLLRKRVLHAI